MNEDRLSAEQPRGSAPEGARDRDRQIARALGLFLSMMALLLVVALPFATLTIDRVLELAAALVLALVAFAFFRVSRAPEK